ncbi:Receptor expression-enhancing protein [Dirofilaria immitis]
MLLNWIILESAYLNLKDYKCTCHSNYCLLLDYCLMENQKRKKPAISSLNDIKPELLKVLYNLPPYFEIQVNDTEKKSGIKREHFIYGLSIFLVLYMIIGSEAGLLCNIICFIYPAIVSIQIRFSVMEKKLMDEAFSLLLYWIIFASFTFTDLYAKGIMKIFPLYWITKCIYCMYLYLPQTKGINIMEEMMQSALQNFVRRQAGEVL